MLESAHMLFLQTSDIQAYKCNNMLAPSPGNKDHYRQKLNFPIGSHLAALSLILINPLLATQISQWLNCLGIK